MEQQQEQAATTAPIVEPPKYQLPTRAKVSETPPAYTEDRKQVKRSEWRIDGKVPVPMLNKWIKTKNLKRDYGDQFHIEDMDKDIFIDNYEDAAQMYREYAAAYNKGTV